MNEAINEVFYGWLEESQKWTPFSENLTACMLDLPNQGRWSPGKVWSRNPCMTKVTETLYIRRAFLGVQTLSFSFFN